MASSLASYGGAGICDRLGVRWERDGFSGNSTLSMARARRRGYLHQVHDSKSQLQSMSGVVTDENVPEGHSGLHGFLYGQAGADVHDGSRREFAGISGEDDGTGVLGFQDYIAARDSLKFAGVYAVYNTNRDTQYIGYSRAVVLALKKHRDRLGADDCSFVRVKIFTGSSMVSRARLEAERQRWLEEQGTVPPGNVEGSESKAAWEVDGSGLQTKVMSENERKDYEEKKLKMRKAMGENLYDDVDGEDEDSKTRRLNLLQAVEGDDWSAVIDGQSKAAVVDDKAEVVSPFSKQQPPASSGLYSAETLEFTVQNVDAVLNEVRPYLIADGGNVTVVSIDDGTVNLQLEGACGSCPSSTSTMKMGIERVLREKFGDAIKDVVDVNRPATALTFETVNKQIDELRAAVVGYGGSVELANVDVLKNECHVKYKGPVPLGLGIKAVIRDKFPDINIVLIEP